MTRIDFHTNIPDKLGYACRLARKAYAARGKVVLLAETSAQAEQLNEALWTLSGTDFVPHVMAGDPLAPETPVIVTFDEHAELPHRDMLVNLTRRTPEGFEQLRARVRDHLDRRGRRRRRARPLRRLPQAGLSADPLRGRPVMTDTPSFDEIPVLTEVVVEAPEVPAVEAATGCRAAAADEADVASAAQEAEAIPVLEAAAETAKASPPATTPGAPSKSAWSRACWTACSRASTWCWKTRCAARWRSCWTTWPSAWAGAARRAAAVDRARGRARRGAGTGPPERAPVLSVLRLF
jgi:DNA polymerase-3 subunit chi